MFAFWQVKLKVCAEVLKRSVGSVLGSEKLASIANTNALLAASNRHIYPTYASSSPTN
jgi:hypothetical protein